MESDNVSGPYIVWRDCGYEGWRPDCYNTLTEALSAQRYESRFVVTKLVNYEVVETSDDRSNNDAQR